MSSPETGASTVRIDVLPVDRLRARRSIYIANPYFVPDAAAIDALVEAKRRGVDVRIMVSGIHNDNWLARQNSVRLYGPLLEAGIEILEYNRTMLHHKTMVVDGVWATVGTTNFDNRSFAHNEENNVCVYDRGVRRHAPRDVRGRRQRLRPCPPLGMAAARRDPATQRAAGGLPRRADLTSALVGIPTFSYLSRCRPTLSFVSSFHSQSFQPLTHSGNLLQ